MKQNKFLLLVIVFFLNSMFLISNEDCYYNGQGCQVEETYDEVEVYPGCFIYVRYNVIRCPGAGIQIDFLNYGFNHTSPNPCLPLYNQIFPFYPNRNVIDEVAWGSIEDYIKETILNKEVDKQVLISTNGKDDNLCGSSNVVTVTFHTSVCEAWCFKDAKFIADPITGNPILPIPFNPMVNIDPQEPIIVAQRITCTEYCCSTVREYCYEKVLIGGEYQYIKHYNETKSANNQYYPCEFA